MKVGVTDHFDSMHQLKGHERCENPHGHTYKVEVTVEGELKKGMVIDFDLLKQILKEVIREFDHRNLNEIIAYPSCENLCIEIHKRLKEKLAYPLSVCIWEGEGKWAQYSG